LKKIKEIMKKAAIYALLITIFYSCGSNDRGELVGIKVKKKWFSEQPFGMVKIPRGSFTMGKQDEDISGTFNTPTKTVTVRPYYMDVTEVTNNEYKSFVHWVRDSIVRTRLGYQAEFAATGASTGENGEIPSGGIQDYKFKDTLENSTPYQKYMYDNYYSLDTIKPLDWSEELIWDQQEYPDVDYV
jgi:sulfatase modifying factor 1